MAGLARAQTQLLLLETTLPNATYSTFALAQDSSSFSPDSPENKGLLDKGFGFPVDVRRVLEREFKFEVQL